MRCLNCKSKIQLDRPCQTCGFYGRWDDAAIFMRDPFMMPLNVEARLFASHTAELIISMQETATDTKH